MDKMKYIKKISLNYYLIFILLITVLILGKGMKTSEFISADAAHHGMDGIFMLDLAKDRPLLNIYDYTVQYYTKYPALKIGFYPPFFAAVEAIFYGLFGISVFSARLTVLFFALIAMIYLFKLIRLIYNQKIAFYSCLLFITTPYVVAWAKTVMLEMPALAMIIVSVYYFYKYIELNVSRYKYYFILSTIAALYTKQTAVFIIPLFFLYIIFTKKHKRLLDKDVFLIGAALLLLALPLAVITLKFGGVNIQQSLGSIEGIRRHPGLLVNILAYPRFLLTIFTYPALVLSLGSVFFLKKYFYKAALFYSWLISFYLLFTYMHVKDPRYTYFWLPPFFVFASLALDAIRGKIKNVPLGSILFILIFSYQFYLSFSYNKPLFSGYEDAAKFILSQPTNKVFYQGSSIGEGNFIYQIRRLDQKRRMVVYRGSKILASYAMYANNALVEHVRSKEEIQILFDDYGLEFFVIEEPLDEFEHGNVKAFKLLREVLKNTEYSLIKTMGLKKERTWAKGEQVLIYKINKERSGKRDAIHMRLPIIGAEITVMLEQLSNFYTPSINSVSTLDGIIRLLNKLKLRN